MGGATVARGKEARARVSASFIVVCPGSGKRRLTVFDRRGRRVEWVALILLAYSTGVSGGVLDRVIKYGVNSDVWF